MSHVEFLSWQSFYAEAPFDDHHRFHRPAVLISQSMSSGNVQDKLDLLVPPIRGELQEYSDADLNTLAALGGKPPAV